MITTGLSAASLPALSNSQVYYVATTGNDNNPGTSALPFLTIQKAFNVLASCVINSNITVNVGSGTFSEEVTIPPLLYAGDYRVTLNGTLTVATSGTSSAASSAYSYSGGVVPAKLTNSSATYTVNQYQKFFLRITGGTGYNATNDALNWYVIRANTATTISITGDWNAALGSNTTYQIVSGATTISGGGTRKTNISFRGDRVTVKGMILSNCIGFASYATGGSKLSQLVGCSISCNAAGSATISLLNAGFRAIGCYCDGTGVPNNIALFEAFSFGEYDEDFKTSASFTESNTGIHGCWIDNSTGNGMIISDSHTRITGCYFSNHATNALEIGRKGSTSLYGNDMTGLSVNVLDPSYLKIHSGNVISSVVGENCCSIYKQNAGGWFSSQVTTMSTDSKSSLYGTGFSASTEYPGARYSCRITKSSAQAVASGTTGVTCTFDTVSYDPNSMKSGNTVIIKAAGPYRLDGGGSFEANASGDRRVVRVLVNSVAVAVDSRSPLNGFDTAMTTGTTRLMAVGDVVTMNVTQNSGSTLNLNAISEYTTYLTVTQL